MPRARSSNIKEASIFGAKRSSSAFLAWGFSKPKQNISVRASECESRKWISSFLEGPWYLTEISLSTLSEIRFVAWQAGETGVDEHKDSNDRYRCRAVLRDNALFKACMAVWISSVVPTNKPRRFRGERTLQVQRVLTSQLGRWGEIADAAKMSCRPYCSTLIRDDMNPSSTHSSETSCATTASSDMLALSRLPWIRDCSKNATGRRHCWIKLIYK